MRAEKKIDRRRHVGPSPAKSRRFTRKPSIPAAAGPEGTRHRNPKPRRSWSLRLAFLPHSSLGASHACLPLARESSSSETCGFEVRLHDSMPHTSHNNLRIALVAPGKPMPALLSVL